VVKAQRLAQLLDESTGGPRHHGRSTHDEGLAGYVRVSEALGRAAGLLPGPDPQFRTSLRAMLVATAERDGIGATVTEEPERGKRARPGTPLVARGRAKGAILVGLAAGTLALSGMSAASGDAMPGDPLYSVKRGAESARLALAGSDLRKGQLFLDFARNRMAEAQSMGAHGPGLSRTLEDMDTETRDGVRLLTQGALDQHDRTGLDLVDEFVHRQRTDLTGLGGSARIRESLALLDRVAARSAQLRPHLTCAAQGGDDLGPTGANCAGPNTGPLRPNSSTGGAPHPESTPAGGTGTAPGGTAPSPTTSPSGLLDDLGRILGGHH
jgi:hypothetical protein